MVSHDPQILRFWGPLIVLSLIGVGALAYEIRRLRYTVWEILGALSVLPLLFVCLVIFIQVGNFALARFEALPKHARAVIHDRISLVVFLFWLSALAYMTLVYVHTLMASFAIIGGSKARWQPQWLWRSAATALEYWTLVERRDELRSVTRIGVAAYHVLFCLAWLCFAAYGLMMTFGVPWLFVARYALLALIAGLALNPAWVDRRIARRLAAADQQAQLLEKWT